MASDRAWSDEEVCVLISYWSDGEVQNKLQGVIRNRPVYEKIAVAMGKKGYQCTWQQCRTKIKNLIARYKKVGC